MSSDENIRQGYINADNAMRGDILNEVYAIERNVRLEINGKLDIIIDNMTKLKAELTAIIVPASGAGVTSDGTCVEIVSGSNEATLVGKAMTETFGGGLSSPLNPNEDVKLTFFTNNGSLSPVSTDDTSVNTRLLLPPSVGSTTITLTATRQSTVDTDTVSVSKTIYTNLRKYFGFSANEPTSVESLSNSHFSNSASCTVEIGANGAGEKYIYFAVPYPMTISSVKQPYALNAPLSVISIGTKYRKVGLTDFQYTLYRSVDKIDSSSAKKLTIN